MNIEATRRTHVLIVALCFTLASCGSSKNPNSPGVSSCSSAGPLGSAKGQITATINSASFTGGVPAGESVYTPIPAQPGLGLAAQDFIIFTGTCGDLTSIQITARATTGTTLIGVDGSGNPLRDPQTQQPLVHSVLLQLRSNGAAAGTWITSQLGGTGSITLTSVSTTSATGSFSLTMAPQAGTGASGNRTVAGQFAVTF
jgi:hypothetical protein